MSNSGKLIRMVSILFVIISVMFLITSIIELCQVTSDDILISVREDGCFKSPEAVMAIIYAGYGWRIMFWITLTLWNIYTAIDSRRK
jgi:hypothetical protein